MATVGTRASRPLETDALAITSAMRLLTFGGILMVLTGMVFGDLFAIFVLHQNASHVASALAAATQAALHGDTSSVAQHFAHIGDFLENRGTKVDAHAHLIAFGYIALALALLQPRIHLTPASRRRFTQLFVLGAFTLPIGVFCIHYVGLAYSPLKSIGWASIVADFGGAAVLVASLAFTYGLLRGSRTSRSTTEIARPAAAQRLLFSGGLLLILAGILYGSFYAYRDLYRHEAADRSILSAITQAAATRDDAVADRALAEYGNLQGDKAVKIAAHAHIIEFGILALLLGALLPVHERGWAWLLLVGSAMLPICVFLEIRFGLFAGALADFGGFFVIIALALAAVRLLRFETVAPTAAAPASPALILIASGLLLALGGMIYGLHYAVFTEHQTLDEIGASLTRSFVAAAQRDAPARSAALDEYSRAKFIYDRQVDAHSHWSGNACILLILGLCLPYASVGKRTGIVLATSAAVGALAFPAGVLLQVYGHLSLGQAIAIAGSVLLTVALLFFASVTIRNGTFT